MPFRARETYRAHVTKQNQDTYVELNIEKVDGDDNDVGYDTTRDIVTDNDIDLSQSYFDGVWTGPALFMSGSKRYLESCLDNNAMSSKFDESAMSYIEHLLGDIVETLVYLAGKNVLAAKRKMITITDIESVFDNVFGNLRHCYVGLLFADKKLTNTTDSTRCINLTLLRAAIDHILEPQLKSSAKVAKYILFRLDTFVKKLIQHPNCRSRTYNSAYRALSRGVQLALQQTQLIALDPDSSADQKEDADTAYDTAVRARTEYTDDNDDVNNEILTWRDIDYFINAGEIEETEFFQGTRLLKLYTAGNSIPVESDGAMYRPKYQQSYGTHYFTTKYPE